MTKSTITREQLEEWVTQFDEDGGCDATDRQLEALIRQSLVAMDSEPVGTLSVRHMSYSGKKIGNQFGFVHSDAAMTIAEGDYPLYRHAQQPVVPEEWTIADAVKFCKETGRQDAGAAMDAWNACRAAMLQTKSLTSINPAPDLVSLQKKLSR